MRIAFLSAIFILYFSFLLSAQEFWNLDFEHGVYPAQPRKWSIEGEGELYSARVDSTQAAHHGRKSLQLVMKEAQVFTFLRIPRSIVGGQSIQFSIYAKSGSSPSPQIMLAFRDPGGGRPIMTSPVQAGNEWKVLTHQTSIQSDYSSDFLLVAVIASGTGTIWLDNVSIKVNGMEKGTGPPDFGEPSTNEIDALNSQLIALANFDKDAGSRTMFGSARVVGIGENSHGSASIYSTKLQLLKFLVQHNGFNVFALESPAVEADAINEYVLGGSSTSEDILRNLVYPSWQTREMLDIVQWIREYNKKATRKVEFRGIDMQDGVAALTALEKLAANNARCLSSISILKQLWISGTTGEKAWPDVHQSASAVEVSFDANDQSLKLDFLRYHTVLLQAVALKGDKSGNTRDDYLAENVALLVREGNRVVVSADNTHVTKASGKMGRRLSETFGNEYLALGMTFGTGSYWAYGPNRYYDVHPPYAGTYEYLLAKAHSREFVLDLRRATGIDLLSHSSGFRSIGSKPQETTQFAEIDIRQHFDVVVYISESEHTVVLTEK
jgi:erythromycin esterase